MKKREKRPKLIDWMICDDIRIEENKKLMFIGVYQDIIALSTVPATLPKFVVYTKWDTSKTPIKDFEFKIIQPDKKAIGAIIGKSLPAPLEGKQKTFIQLMISPFQIPVPGKYKIVMKVNKTTYNVGAFEVVLMSEKTKEEPAIAQ